MSDSVTGNTCSESLHVLQWENTAALSAYYSLFGEPVSTKSYKTREKVQELWTKVVEEKDPKAMVILGALYTIGCKGIIKKDYPQAYSLFTDAAERKDSDAMIYLLWMALVAKKDASGKAALTTVVERIKKGSDENIPGALAALGMLYDAGILSIPADYHKRDELYVKAAQLGCTLAMVLVGVQKSAAEGERWCFKAIEAGNGHGYYGLGIRCLLEGDRASRPKAIEYLQKGIEIGDRGSLLTLADAYGLGIYFPADEKRAKELYEKGADEGDGYAMECVGNFYARQRLGKRALFWYEKAFHGDPEDSKFLAEKIAELKFYGCGDLPANPKSALLWFGKGAELGNTTSMTFLSLLRWSDEFKRVRGNVTIDRREARRWSKLGRARWVEGSHEYALTAHFSLNADICRQRRPKIVC